MFDHLTGFWRRLWLYYLVLTQAGKYLVKETIKNIKKRRVKEPSQIARMEFLLKKSWQVLKRFNIFAKTSILDIWLDSEYKPEILNNLHRDYSNVSVLTLKKYFVEHDGTTSDWNTTLKKQSYSNPYNPKIYRCNKKWICLLTVKSVR